MIGWAPPARRLAIDTTIGINESDILEVRIMSLLKTPKLSSRRRAFLLIAASLLLLTPCVAAAKFALSFVTSKQEPASSSSPQPTQELRQKQEREVEELKHQVVELKQRMRTAPETQRAELEARLNEVQRNLDQFKSAGAQAKLLEVQRTVDQFKREKQQQDEQQLRQLRETLAELEKTRPADETRLKAMRDKIAAIEIDADKQKRDLLAQLNDEKMRELKEKLAESEKPYGDGDRKAKLIYRVEPEYSADAREKKIEGIVLLGFTIDHEGIPQNIQVKKPLYPSLDQAAIEAVRKWRFEPAMKGGQPVSMWVNAEVYFRPEYSAQDPKEREAREKREMEEREAREKAEMQESTVRGRRGITEGERKGEFQGEQYGVLLNREAERRAEREMESKQKAELASHVRITMDHAIQIATSQTPGRVLECSLIGERWEAPGKLGKDSLVLYHVVILSGDDASPVTYHVLVNALDGTIFRTSKEERRIGFAETPRAPIQGGALNGKAASLPPPEYPEIAKRAHASGSVTVEITIDEAGNVISAHAVSGHPLLQAAAVTAARQASFAPTRLNGEPVKVAGVLIYNFMAQ